MKTNNKTFFTFVFFLLATVYSNAQDIEKQESGDLATLTLKSGGLKGIRAIIEFESNGKIFEYDSFINKKFPKIGKLDYERTMVIESFRFMLDNGYECISSLGIVYNNRVPIKEYVFRKK